VPQTELFARVSGAGNALVIDTGAEGSIVLTGQGAGRWPTTESVLGDLFELARARTRTETPALAV
jgi:homoserine dehydrogenase